MRDRRERRGSRSFIQFVFEFCELRKEMLVGLELAELAIESERLISSISFNSSTATAIVSIVAISLLLVSTALYLFNYYNKPARSDDVPQYNPYGTYDPNYRYKR